MKTALDFLRQLAQNNQRDWFLEHKNWYEEARQEVISFTEKLISEMQQFDSRMQRVEAEKSLYRIYRDTRFSSDKSPYKTHFGVRLGGGAKHYEARYYLHIQPDDCFLAGGIYMPEKEVLKSIRKRISEEATTFQNLISEPMFKKYFNDFREDNKLKRIPADFDKNHPMAEYLKLKDFVAICPIAEKQLLGENAPKDFAKIYKTLKPLNDFLEEK